MSLVTRCMTDAYSLLHRLVGATILMVVAGATLPWLLDGAGYAAIQASRHPITERPLWTTVPGFFAAFPSVQPPHPTPDFASFTPPSRTEATASPPGAADPTAALTFLPDGREVSLPEPIGNHEPPPSARPVAATGSAASATTRPAPLPPGPPSSGSTPPPSGATISVAPATAALPVNVLARTSPDIAAGWTIQTGSFRDQANARAQLQLLQEHGFPAFIEPFRNRDLPYWRVKVGLHPQRAQAIEVRDALQQRLNLPGILVSHP